MIRFSAVLARIILRAAAWLCFAAACGLALLDCARSVAFSRLSFAPLSAVWTQIFSVGMSEQGVWAVLGCRLPAFMVFLLAGLILFYLSLLRPNWRRPWLYLRRRLRLIRRGRAAGIEIGDKLCP